MVPSVPTSVWCLPVVAQRTRATGVVEDIPAAESSPVIAARRSTPMSMTLVPGAEAIDL